jgi:hypothetical protein
MLFVGLGKLQLRAKNEAVDWLRKSIEADPNSFPLSISFSPLPSCYLARWMRGGPPRKLG